MSGRMTRMTHRPHYAINDRFIDFKGSLPMYSMHEALARDRMREAEQRSAEARLVRDRKRVV